MRRITTEFQDIVVPHAAVLREEPIASQFENDNPLEVDVGSGKGRFLLARALENPNTNYWGIERQQGRVLRTAKKAHRLRLQNVRITRVDAVEGITALVPDKNVSAFYIFFPDPWPKRRHHRRRLIGPSFMDLIVNKLTDDGCVHFASDHQDYAEAVQHCFSNDSRFSRIDPFQPSEQERTNFEILFANQGKPISRLSIQKANHDSPRTTQ